MNTADITNMVKAMLARQVLLEQRMGSYDVQLS